MKLSKDYVSIQEKMYILEVFETTDMQMGEALELIRLLSCGSEQRLKSLMDTFVPTQYQDCLLNK